jgi:hypothetical protein
MDRMPAPEARRTHERSVVRCMEVRDRVCWQLAKLERAAT